jgi:hypothetical protein
MDAVASYRLLHRQKDGTGEMLLVTGCWLLVYRIARAVAPATNHHQPATSNQ